MTWQEVHVKRLHISAKVGLEGLAEFTQNAVIFLHPNGKVIRKSGHQNTLDK